MLNEIDPSFFLVYLQFNVKIYKKKLFNTSLNVYFLLIISRMTKYDLFGFGKLHHFLWVYFSYKYIDKENTFQYFDYIYYNKNIWLILCMYYRVYNKWYIFNWIYLFQLYICHIKVSNNRFIKENIILSM